MKEALLNESQQRQEIQNEKTAILSRIQQQLISKLREKRQGSLQETLFFGFAQ